MLSQLLVCSLVFAVTLFLNRMSYLRWPYIVEFVWVALVLGYLGWLVRRYRFFCLSTQAVAVNSELFTLPRLLGGHYRFQIADLYSVESLTRKGSDSGLLLGFRGKVPFFLERSQLCREQDYQQLATVLRSHAARNAWRQGLAKAPGEQVIRRPSEVVLVFFLVTWVLLYGLGARQSGFQHISEAMLDAGGNIQGSLLTPQFYQMFSAVFLHLNISHLLVNIALLGLIGSTILRLLGTTALLALFLFSALAGNVVSNLFSGSDVSVGASGGLYGLVGCYVLLQARYRDLMPASTMMASNGWVFLLLSAEFLLKQTVMPYLDLWGHMGGFAAGLVAARLMVPRERLFASPARLETGIAWVLGAVYALACAVFLFTLL